MEGHEILSSYLHCYRYIGRIVVASACEIYNILQYFAICYFVRVMFWMTGVVTPISYLEALASYIFLVEF